MKVSLKEYKQDPLYPKIVNAVFQILKVKKFVAPIELFRALGLIDEKQIEDWRFGRIPYLEKAIKCNLTKASRILQIFRYHVRDLNMIPSTAIYKKFGKGPKIILRFSKTGEKNIEEAYSRHFLKNEKKEKEIESPENIEFGEN
jgi:hypothetical protein